MEDKADLYLRRGALYRAHRDWDSAIKDCETARTLGSDANAVDLCIALAHQGAGRLSESLEVLETLLARKADDVRVTISQAQVLRALGRKADASEAYDRAVKESARRGTPRIELYVERARLLASRGDEHVGDAILGLDQGLESFGQVAPLQLCAIELEVRRKHYDAALKRIDRVVRERARQEKWLLRRGEVLEAAGRLAEARAAYTAALEATDRLPRSRRQTRLVLELRKKALERRAALEKESLVDGKQSHE